MGKRGERSMVDLAEVEMKPDLRLWFIRIVI